MSTRSLFSINATPNPQAIGGLGELFGGHVAPNPNYDPNDPKSQPYIRKFNPFKAAPDEANAALQARKILAKFTSDTALQNELKRKRGEMELSREFEDKDLTDYGASIGPAIANLPESERKMFPTTFNSPLEQGRAANAIYGAKTPAAQWREKSLIPFGQYGGRMNVNTNEIMEPGRFVPQENYSQMPVHTGKYRPKTNPNTGEIEFGPNGMPLQEEIVEYVPKLERTEKYVPGNRGYLRPAATQEDFDKIPSDPNNLSNYKLNLGSYPTSMDVSPSRSNFLGTNHDPRNRFGRSLLQPQVPDYTPPIANQPDYFGSEFAGKVADPYSSAIAPQQPTVNPPITPTTPTIQQQPITPVTRPIQQQGPYNPGALMQQQGGNILNYLKSMIDNAKMKKWQNTQSYLSNTNLIRAKP